MNPLISLAMGWIAPQQFFYLDCFSIELPIKVYMPLQRDQTKKEARFCFNKANLISSKSSKPMWRVTSIKYEDLNLST